MQYWGGKMSQLMNRKVLVIVGQTAVGKTALSLQLAQLTDGAILSADSRLFYKGMDIGTAKPNKEEQAQAPHHFVDICAPDQTITLGEYQTRAYATIDQLHEEGTFPIIVGGTGQYVWAVIEGWGIPRVPPQPDLRRVLEEIGKEECYRWLVQLDPTAAQKIHPNNMRRIVRALEVTLVSGWPISHLQRKTPPPYEFFIVGLKREREALYQRIDQRVEQMIAHGLEAEVRALLETGYSPKLPSMSGLGYKQMVHYVRGLSTHEEMIERIQVETHRFARNQNTWFRPDDERIHWFDLTHEPDAEERVISKVMAWYQERPSRRAS